MGSVIQRASISVFVDVELIIKRCEAMNLLFDSSNRQARHDPARTNWTADRPS
jgi:hypothetical protein